MQYLDKEEIVLALENIFAEFSVFCNSINTKLFFEPVTAKWSIAENVQHLVMSARFTTLAYTLPLFLVKLIGGKSRHKQSTYDELVLRYKNLLADGARANKRFTPKPMNIKYGREKLVSNWERTTARLIAALKYNTTEIKLDAYFVKHPLLGRISLRELCYFTIYHTQHHLSIIKNRVEND